MHLKTIFLTTLFTLVTFNVQAGVQCTDLFTRSISYWGTTSGTIFDQMRQSNRHFWDWGSRQEIPKEWLAEGVVGGDFHLGNVRETLINRKRRFVFFDLDDAGRGPFLLDFVKFVSISRTDRLGISFEEFFKAYLKGLNRNKMQKPDFVEENLNMSKSDERKKQEKFVDKIIEGKRFILGKKQLKSLQESSLDTKMLYAKSRPYFEKALQGYEILDVAVRIRKEGGSAGKRRFWHLVRNEDKEKFIIEFKEVGEPGVSAYRKQRPFVERINEVTDVYWKGEVDPLYQPIDTGEANFLMRPRYDDPDYMIPLTTKKEKEMARELVLYDANHMGRRVARQEVAKKYIDFMNSHREEALMLIEKIVREYEKIIP